MKKVLALALALVMVLALLVGCGSEGGKPDSKDNNKTNNEGSGTYTPIENSYDQMPTALAAEKIGSLNASWFVAHDCGITYRNDENIYGVMSYDGKADSGAKYVTCEVLGDYFLVSVKNPYSELVAEALNCRGLVDCCGNQVIPMEYALIKMLSDRFYQVYQVTEQTDNKDEALVYYTTDMFSITADDDDILFKGNWYVWDVEQGKCVDGLVATNPYQVQANGACIRYVTDEKQNATVNDLGQLLPENATLFQNGYYRVETDWDEGTVYDAHGNKLFDYGKDDYTPVGGQDEYIVGVKSSETQRQYALLDTTGKVVHALGEESPSEICGNMIVCYDEYFWMDGGDAPVGYCDSVYSDEYFEDFCWAIKKDDEYMLLDADGTVLCQGSEAEGYQFDVYNGLFVEKNGLYYCMNTKDFSLQGKQLAPWLLHNDGSVIDTISGNTIIQGYQTYKYSMISGNVIYVYATNAEGVTDIFVVK